jgi:hypothetical protein
MPEDARDHEGRDVAHAAVGGDSRPAAVTFVRTEHFTLHGARSATIAKSTGRATMFLSSVSGGLIALGLIATASRAFYVLYAFYALYALYALYAFRLTPTQHSRLSGWSPSRACSSPESRTADTRVASRCCAATTPTKHPNSPPICSASRTRTGFMSRVAGQVLAEISNFVVREGFVPCSPVTPSDRRLGELDAEGSVTTACWSEAVWGTPSCASCAAHFHDQGSANRSSPASRRPDVRAAGWLDGPPASYGSQRVR